MKQYIDSEKLETNIKKLKNGLKSLMSQLYYAANYKEWEAELNGYNKILSLIDSLQQEQLNLDLEQEVEKFCLEYDARKEVWFDMTPKDQKMLSAPTWSNFAVSIARHFWNKGYNARKEESVSVVESPSKTFPKVNEFDCGSSYRH